jgi:hypothetical protein
MKLVRKNGKVTGTASRKRGSPSYRIATTIRLTVRGSRAGACLRSSWGSPHPGNSPAGALGQTGSVIRA